MNCEDQQITEVFAALINYEKEFDAEIVQKAVQMYDDYCIMRDEGFPDDGWI